MSLDLTLLPYNYPDHDHIRFSHIVLPLQTSNYDLMEEIQRVSEKDTPQSVNFIKGEGKQPNGFVEKDFSCYLARGSDGENCYGEVTEDAYGKHLKWVRVRELLKIDKKLWRNPQDIAALAYISALDLDNRVALYWS